MKTKKKKNQNAHFIGEFCFYENYKNSRKAVKVKPGEEKRKRGNVRTQRERKAKHQSASEQAGKMDRKKKSAFWQKARHYIEKKKEPWKRPIEKRKPRHIFLQLLIKKKKKRERSGF